MALFTKITEVKPILYNGATPALGNKGVTYTIPRQSRRLDHIMVHFRITMSGTMTRTANFTDTLEGICPEIRLRVSDRAGSNRLAVQCPSQSLIFYSLRTVGKIGRHTASIIASSTAATTYNFAVPIWVRDPLLSETIGVKTCLPLDSREGAGDDVRLELDFANDAAALGFSASPTITINAVRAAITYREMPAEVPYIPGELKTNTCTWSQNPDGWEFPQMGWLCRFLMEGFTATVPTRGDPLTSALVDYYRFKYGRQDRRQFFQINGEEEDEYWSDYFQPQTSAYNPVGLIMSDFMHDSVHGEGVSPGTLLNLYTSNKGDLARVEPTSTGANSFTKFTTYKFLTEDITQLIGA